MIQKFRDNLFRNNYANINNVTATNYYCNSPSSLLTNGKQMAVDGSLFLPENFNSLPANKKSYLASNTFITPRENIYNNSEKEYGTSNFNVGANGFSGMVNPLNIKTVQFEIANTVIESLSKSWFLTFNTRLILDQFIANSMAIQFQKQHSKEDSYSDFSSRSNGLNFNSPYIPRMEQQHAVPAALGSSTFSSSYSDSKDINTYYHSPYVAKDYATVSKLLDTIKEAENTLNGVGNTEVEAEAEKFLHDTSNFDRLRSEIQSSVANFDREFEKLNEYHVMQSSSVSNNYPITPFRK